MARVTARDADGQLWMGRHRVHMSQLWKDVIAKQPWYSSGLLPTDEFPSTPRPDFLRNGETVRPLVTTFDAQVEDGEPVLVTVLGCDSRTPGVTQRFRLSMKLFGFRLRIDEITGADVRARRHIRHVAYLEAFTDSESLLRYLRDDEVTLGGRSLRELHPFVLSMMLPNPTAYGVAASYRPIGELGWRAECRLAGWNDDELDRALPPCGSLRYRPFAAA